MTDPKEVAEALEFFDRGGIGLGVDQGRMLAQALCESQTQVQALSAALVTAREALRTASELPILATAIANERQRLLLAGDNASERINHLVVEFEDSWGAVKRASAFLSYLDLTRAQALLVEHEAAIRLLKNMDEVLDQFGEEGEGLYDMDLFTAWRRATGFKTREELADPSSLDAASKDAKEK